MALGGVDWRMAQPMQAGVPDWRQIMQTAVMGGADILNPMTLPGMLDQIEDGKKGGGTKKPPTDPKPPATTTMKPTYTPIKPGVQWKGPDGGMFDIYGNVWTPGGYLLTPGGM